MNAGEAYKEARFLRIHLVVLADKNSRGGGRPRKGK